MKAREYFATAAVIGLVAVSVAGCASIGADHANESGNAAQPSSEKTEASNQGSAKLWAQNCSSCHSLKEPGSYSDAQWEAVMFHMRVRANLTAAEHKTVLDFLKSSN